MQSQNLKTLNQTGAQLLNTETGDGGIHSVTASIVNPEIIYAIYLSHESSEHNSITVSLQGGKSVTISDTDKTPAFSILGIGATVTLTSDSVFRSANALSIPE